VQLQPSNRDKISKDFLGRQVLIEPEPRIDYFLKPSSGKVAQLVAQTLPDALTTGYWKQKPLVFTPDWLDLLPFWYFSPKTRHRITDAAKLCVSKLLAWIWEGYLDEDSEEPNRGPAVEVPDWEKAGRYFLGSIGLFLMVIEVSL
jgi:hypothetical protein